MTIKNKPVVFECDGLTFGRVECNEMRDNLIRLRDIALRQASFEQAVILSHTIAVFAMMRDHIWGPEPKPPAGEMAAGIIHEPGTNG